MKIILIDDHGNVKVLGDEAVGTDKVMLAAQEEYFSPCETCGKVCFVEDTNETRCKFC